MKLTLPTLRIAGALGLAAGLMIGCQDLLNPGQSASDPGATADGSLSLSIKDDSACRGEWHAILDARGAGHPDSASEAAFLASCVTEVRPQKDKPKPVIPPALLPDSGTRCKWIVSQIEGGRDSLTVSYRKYCPDDCRKLEAADSASHEKFCREPGPVPPPPHHEGDDTCKVLRMRLDSVKPGEPGRADLEHLFAARCLEPMPPHDTLPPPPHHEGGDDTCRMLRAELDSVKPGQPGRADLEHLYMLRCQEPVPHDSILPPPPPVCDTAKLPPPNPPPLDSVCAELKLRLAATAPGTAGRSELEAAFKAHCVEVLPPPPPPTTLNCDELRHKLALLDTGSADYARLSVTLKEHCPVVQAK